MGRVKQVPKPSRVDKQVTTEVKAVDEKKRQVRMVLTTLAVDRDGDVVVPMGAQVENFQKNPIVLYSHMSIFPIGNITQLEPKDISIEGTIEFFEKDESPLADRLFKLYSRRKMRAGSIGFLPTKMGEKPILPGQTGATFEEWELLEFSLVSIPSNAGALTVERQAEIKSFMKSLSPDESEDPEDALNDLFGDEGEKAKNRDLQRTLILRGAEIERGIWAVAIDKNQWESQALHVDNIEFVEDLGALEKAGKVLSQKNFSRLEQAKAILDEVLETAGENEPPPQDDEDKLLRELADESKLFLEELSLLAPSSEPT